MDSSRWERIQELFHTVADLPVHEQDVLLAEACGTDAELIKEVRAMLKEDSNPTSMLNRDVAEVAHDVLGKSDGSRLPNYDFGAYRLVRLLGEGGMGLVYLA